MLTQKRKRRSGFVTPFSQQAKIKIHGHTEPRQPDGKEMTPTSDLKMSPLHLGRMQTITPNTRRKIKERFSRGMVLQCHYPLTSGYSPGFPVPFDVSESQSSFDQMEEITDLNPLDVDTRGNSGELQQTCYTGSSNLPATDKDTVTDDVRNMGVDKEHVCIDICSEVELSTQPVVTGGENFQDDAEMYAGLGADICTAEINKGLTGETGKAEINMDKTTHNGPEVDSVNATLTTVYTSKKVLPGRTADKEVNTCYGRNVICGKLSNRMNSNTDIQKAGGDVKKRTHNSNKIVRKRHTLGRPCSTCSIAHPHALGTRSKRKDKKRNRQKLCRDIKSKVLRTVEKMHLEIQELQRRRKQLFAATECSYPQEE